MPNNNKCYDTAMPPVQARQKAKKQGATGPCVLLFGSRTAADQICRRAVSAPACCHAFEYPARPDIHPPGCHRAQGSD